MNVCVPVPTCTFMYIALHEHFHHLESKHTLTTSLYAIKGCKKQVCNIMFMPKSKCS